MLTATRAVLLPGALVVGFELAGLPGAVFAAFAVWLSRPAVAARAGVAQ
jgi:hypothetical protein